MSLFDGNTKKDLQMWKNSEISPNDSMFDLTYVWLSLDRNEIVRSRDPRARSSQVLGHCIKVCKNS